MASGAGARLSELLAGTRALALVGLAKNTGKTVTLAAILAEHAAAGRTVGVTSIGRDGEQHDVIDARIDKPRVQLQAGSLVATTGALLRASGLAHERLAQTGVRTPLGEVVLVRLPAHEAGDDDRERITLERRLVLSGQPAEIAALLREHPRVDVLLVEGALGERFLEGLLAARSERAGRQLRIVAGDPTKVFLARRGPRWYERQGIAIEVLQTIELRAITVNPLAPQSHGFDSRVLRELIESAVADVPVLDVLDESYLALAK